MGDIWLPGYPPAYTDWGHCLIELQRLGMDRANAEILAAIGGPESGYDWTVINDTPSTGDYSVGIWQINYYGSLYQGRVQQFGTPKHLIACGLLCQARAAHIIWQQQGFDAWYTTYHSGAWKKYIGSGPVPSPPGFPGSTTPPPPGETAASDWSGHVRRTSAQLDKAARTLHKRAVLIQHIRLR